MPRLSPLALLAAAALGIAIGLFIQFALSARGSAPLIPPITLPITLVLLGALLIVLGIRLRRHVRRGTGAVNPFHAVRLLATARAGQIVGSFLGGFGAGLALSLLGRSVPAPVPTWLPMIVTLVCGVILIACGLVTEHLCRVPPGGDDEQDSAESEPGGDAGPAVGTATRTRTSSAASSLARLDP